MSDAPKTINYVRPNTPGLEEAYNRIAVAAGLGNYQNMIDHMLERALVETKAAIATYPAIDTIVRETVERAVAGLQRQGKRPKRKT